MPRETIEIQDPEMARTLYGDQDSHLRLLRDAFGVTVVAREGVVSIEGSEDGLDEFVD